MPSCNGEDIAPSAGARKGADVLQVFCCEIVWRIFAKERNANDGNRPVC